MAGTRQSPLKRYLGWGQNFVDAVNLPEFEFRRGHVERVFTHPLDKKGYIGTLKVKYQKIQLELFCVDRCRFAYLHSNACRIMNS